MATLGVDIQALVIGAGSIIVSFAFMIGPTSSNYLEVRKFVPAISQNESSERSNSDIH